MTERPGPTHVYTGSRLPAVWGLYLVLVVSATCCHAAMVHLIAVDGLQNILEWGARSQDPPIEIDPSGVLGMWPLTRTILVIVWLTLVVAAFVAAIGVLGSGLTPLPLVRPPRPPHDSLGRSAGVFLVVTTAVGLTGFVVMTFVAELRESWEASEFVSLPGRGTGWFSATVRDFTAFALAMTRIWVATCVAGLLVGFASLALRRMRG